MKRDEDFEVDPLAVTSVQVLHFLGCSEPCTCGASDQVMASDERRSGR